MRPELKLAGIVIFFAATFGTVACFAREPEPTFDARNVVFNADGARVATSGRVVYLADFRSRDGWREVNNYESKLDIEFGAVEDGAPTLRISRSKPVGEGEKNSEDSAWSVASNVQPIAEGDRGKKYAVRMLARSTKRVEGAGSDGKTWTGGVTWFDSAGEELETTPFVFSCGRVFDERRLDGIVPENAAGFQARIGFDGPNILPGESVVVSKLSLEIVDPSKPYSETGEFFSGISRGKTTYSAETSTPGASALIFELYEAPNVDGLPGKFRLKSSTRIAGADESFEVKSTAPFSRYRVILEPDDENTPVLESVAVNGKTTDRWRVGGDSTPPRVRLVGARAKPNPDPHARVAIAIQDDSFVLTDSVKVEIDDKDATARFAKTEDVDGAVVMTERLKPNYAPGLHKVVVSARDYWNNTVEATRYFLAGEAPNLPTVSLRDDGTTLIDGEPFFPIGIYGVMEREFNGGDIDEAFRGLKEAGFNFAHSYSIPREDRFLRAAEKYGFKLWSVARFPDERFVEVERFSPAILAWYLGDDTSHNTTPERLDDYFFSVKAVDPSRLTVQADPIDAASPVSNYRPYVAGTDAFLPEIYPVKDDGDAAGRDCVAQTVMDVRRARSDALDADDGPKAIWPIIQYFQGWGWKRFPTYPELRGMSFAALAAGGNGITWYTYGGTVEPENGKFNYGVTTSPERWKNISTIATQINELSPVLLEPTDPDAQPRGRVLSGPERNTLDGDTIVCLLKRREGENYLLAVNTTPEEVEARFEFASPQPDGKPETLYDEQNVSRAAFSDGVLTDVFEPFGVRIWRWREAAK